MTRHNHKKGFRLLRSSSEAIAPKTRRGFNLIEAAIVLGVVGLVIGGIWVAASALQRRHFETQFFKGLLVLHHNSQKYLSLRDACGDGYFRYSRPEMEKLIYPKEWLNIGASGGGIMPGDELLIPCDGGGKTVYLLYMFYTNRYICNSLVPKIISHCARLGCDIGGHDWACSQPDGAEIGIAFPLPYRN